MHNSSGSMPLSPGFVPCFFPLSIQFHPLIAPFHPTPTPLVLAYLFWWVASSPPLWQSALQKSVPLAEYKWHQQGWLIGLPGFFLGFFSLPEKDGCGRSLLLYSRSSQNGHFPLCVPAVGLWSSTIRILKRLVSLTSSCYILSRTGLELVIQKLSYSSYYMITMHILANQDHLLLVNTDSETAVVNVTYSNREQTRQ